MDYTVEELVAELHRQVKALSSVPKVAEKIGMNYYSLRDNLNGTSDIRLRTFYAVLDAIGLTEDQLKVLLDARPREQHEGSGTPDPRS